MQAYLESKRLIIRDIEDKDYLQLFYFRNQSELCDLSGMKRDETITDTIITMQKIDNLIYLQKLFYWGIFLKDNSTLIGVISFSNPDKIKNGGEFGYFIGFPYQRQGYMSEAFQTVLDYLVKQGNSHFNLYIREDNRASQEFAQSFLFKPQERLLAEDMAGNQSQMIRYYRFINIKEVTRI